MRKNALFPRIVKSIKYKPIKNKKGLIATSIGGALKTITSLGKGVWGK